MADRQVIITFADEGSIGEYIELDVYDTVTTINEVKRIEWVATPANSTQVSVVSTPQGGTSGAGAAQSFALAFQQSFSSNGEFNISIDDNVVIMTISPDLPDLVFFISRIGGNLAVINILDYVSTLTVSAGISGQELTSTTSYCYLYEPLLATIEESNITSKKVYIDLLITNTDSQYTAHVELIKYGEFDVNPNRPIKIDLMDLVRQYHNAKVYKIGLTSDITDSWRTVVSEFVYDFKIYSDTTVNSWVRIRKLPIIGGRDFQDFTPAVTLSTPITEAALEGVDLTERWENYPTIATVLATPTDVDATPTVTVTNQTVGCEPKGGFAIWKSHLGGWMSWGFKISTKTYSKKYTGRLDISLFDSTEDVGGHIYKPVDYTGISTTSSISLKDLSLNTEELNTVAKIAFSPAVYYVGLDGKMELMRVTSSKTPLKNLSNGGDFSLSLKSIGMTEQDTM